jgi:hypothetical protein
MTGKETSDKPSTAPSGIKKITPKEESDYDRMIREKQESQMDGCCGGMGYRPHYDYKPRPVSKTADTTTPKK